MSASFRGLSLHGVQKTVSSMDCESALNAIKWDGQAYRRCPVALLTGLTTSYTEKVERQGILGYAVPRRIHLVQPLNSAKKSLKWDSLAQPLKDAVSELIQCSGSWRIKCHEPSDKVSFKKKHYFLLLVCHPLFSDCEDCGCWWLHCHGDGYFLATTRASGAS